MSPRHNLIDPDPDPDPGAGAARRTAALPASTDRSDSEADPQAGTHLDNVARFDPAPGRTPRAVPTAAYTGALIAVLLIGVGAVGIHDGVVAAGWISGRSWTGAAIDSIDGLSPAGAMIPAGIVAALIGLWLVLTSLSPRRKKAVDIDSATALFIEPSDIARISSITAESVSGVLSARTSATRTKVTIQVETTGDAATPGAVADAVRTALTSLTPVPKVSVRTRTGGTR